MSFRDRVSRIGALDDPVRRELYLYVCVQPGPVGRDEAAAALDIPVHKAKFHLDRLEREGLLDAEFARITGRTGPGAGRTSKLYRRAPGEVSVSLPEREYALAGRLMAEAIADSVRTGESAAAALERLAAGHGRRLGAAAATEFGRPADAAQALDTARRALAGYGYEPRVDEDELTLVNCPFHALAQEQTELVCGMNHALVDGVASELDGELLACALEPAPDRCCVVLRPA
ncbi:metalloregulator ArsR/SmtB family transcription factor [Tsukamurella sp. 1534]|uniref:helix-turn-helix transcriptional regulator n=1 Tax=Tsukamurella sp. 1534 TaxID=1151061 RepID=UPI000684E3CD|nr:helix-turn-helix domain-containing protein [Tsukamurella sp. 1534]